MTATHAQRSLAQIHNGLRNLGLNPLEALAVISDLLLDPDRTRSAYPAAAEQAEALFAGGETGETLANALQQFLSDDLRSTFGQYLTPRPVAVHVAELLRRHATGLIRSVLDPFAGSGILLEASAELWPSAAFRGVEINPAVAHVGRAVASMSGADIAVEVADAFSMWSEGRVPAVDLVIANPPFGAHADHVDVRTLGGRETSTCLSGIRRIPAEVLALELCSDVLRAGGTMAVVLPSSILTNHGLRKWRSQFFGRNLLLHVTDLPAETFAPFKGVTNACVIVARKTEVTLAPTFFSVWRPRGVGYDATGRPGISDLESSSLSERAEVGTLGADGAVSLRADRPAEEGVLRLGDIAEIFRGKNPDRSEYTDSGPFLLKVGSLAGSFVSWRTRERSYVPQAWFDSVGNRQLRVGDICLTATAHTPRYIGLKVDMIDALPPLGAAASAELIVIRLKSGAAVSPVQLLFFLRSAAGRAAIQAYVRGATAHVYPRDLATLQVTRPAKDPEVLEKLYWASAAAFREYLAREAEAYLESDQPVEIDLG